MRQSTSSHTERALQRSNRAIQKELCSAIQRKSEALLSLSPFVLAPLSTESSHLIHDVLVTNFVIEERDDVVVVPKDAVVLRNNRPVIFTVQRQTAKETRVVLGLDGGTSVEIVEGLEPDQRYVTVGQQTLSDKSPVRPR